MKIKICGLKREEDIEYVNVCKPDYIGFVFAGQKRKIDYDTAKHLKSKLDSSIRAVGVFVNENIEFIDRLVCDNIIDMIQLHGDEDENYISRLKEHLSVKGNQDIPIIKGVRVRSKEQVLESESLPVDYLLLDAFSEKDYGGVGVTFNHELIPELCKPYMLAGGIGFENVTKIIENISLKNVSVPVCIDVSSSVETDGNKDYKKIKEMVNVVRRL